MTSFELWITERQTADTSIGLRVKSTLRREVSPYQELLVVETYAYGRALLLDGAIQTTERDEFFYHEMLVHPALFAHPHPRRVLVVGGGDGGSLREVLRHPEVEEAVLCDIDERVTRASRDFFPTLAVAFDDPRAVIRHEDAIAFVATQEAAFDVVIVDSTDPVGPAVGLYEAPFYASVRKALRPGGLVVAQSESPFHPVEPLLRVQRALRSVFPHVALYLGPVPTYPSGMWSYSVASLEPTDFLPRRPLTFPTRYYTPDVHRAAFVLPPYVREILPEEA